MVASRSTIHVCGVRVGCEEGGATSARLHWECGPALLKQLGQEREIREVIWEDQPRTNDPITGWIDFLCELASTLVFEVG